jgi:hypothetical protein
VSPQDAGLFPVLTPLGFSVRTTANYWVLIEAKHPKLRGRLAEVAQVLRVPEEIRRSQRDPTVYLFYRTISVVTCVLLSNASTARGFLLPPIPAIRSKKEMSYGPSQSDP